MPLVNESLQFWSDSVDPQKIAIPRTCFETPSKVKPLDNQGLPRIHMTMDTYCDESWLQKATPTPDQAGFIAANDIYALCKEQASFTVPVASAADKLHEV